MPVAGCDHVDLPPFVARCKLCMCPALTKRKTSVGRLGDGFEYLARVPDSWHSFLEMNALFIPSQDSES